MLILNQDHIPTGTKTSSTTRRFDFSTFDLITIPWHRRQALAGWVTLPSPSITYLATWCKFSAASSFNIKYPSLVFAQRIFDTLFSFQVLVGIPHLSPTTLQRDQNYFKGRNNGQEKNGWCNQCYSRGTSPKLQGKLKSKRILATQCQL